MTEGLTLPDDRRRPVVARTVGPAVAQPQQTGVVPPAEERHARLGGTVLELVASEVRVQAIRTVPAGSPLGELNQCRESLGCRQIGLTPEYVWSLALVGSRVEAQPHRCSTAGHVRCQLQVPLVHLDVVRPPLGVAVRGNDLAPQGVEAVRHMQEQNLGARAGHELLGRLGQSDAGPELDAPARAAARGYATTTEYRP